ncbi:MAG: Gfo/Idh/MocA family oxidoreductase [Victivallaceae bacterium]
MLQLTQKLRDGSMLVQDVPMPQIGPGMLLVRNHYSLISAGTEGSTAKAARKSLIGKIKERPDQFCQVLDVIRKQGVVQAYRAVTKKLEAYSPCGYSCSGVVIGVAPDVAGFKLGDKVACAGAGFANHAEVVAVPVNLCVRLNENADLRSAAYNTLGAIAMQGVRQADLRLGESAAVIGLGLLGRLTALLLRASGVRVVGIDVSLNQVLAAKADLDLALERGATGIEDRIAQFTGGCGVDSCIITAGTSSLDPINFAGKIVRKKGTVVVVGAVPTGFDRNPDYYPKELTLKMSCSYGPGRYDPKYEERGIDYPQAYVRWTENRNMQAFQELIQSRNVHVDALTTHLFALADAPKAYDMIVNHLEPFVGVILEYDQTQALSDAPVKVHPKTIPQRVSVAFVGAGSYAQGNLLPNLPQNIRRVAVMTNTGTTSKRVAERFHFEFCTANESDIFGNPEINTVFVATRHDSHAGYVVKALEHQQSVFVEKPLALDSDELSQIMEAQKRSGGQLMVGFNRRFAPLARKLKAALPKVPVSMLYRVNAGAIPADHWIQDRKIGGGRIIGEGCHFIDFMAYICGALPIRIGAVATPDVNGLGDTLNVNIEFADGSIGVLCYYANGCTELPKEYFEVHGAGCSAVLNDFRELTVYGRKKIHAKSRQDKGQQDMMNAFFAGLNAGTPAIEPVELERVTQATFAVARSLREHQTISLA